MTLNGLIALILRFSSTFIALQIDCVTAVEDRPIMSVKYCLPIPVFYFWPKLPHPAARSLCDSRASCIDSGTLSVASALLAEAADPQFRCVRFTWTCRSLFMRSHDSDSKNAWPWLDLHFYVQLCSFWRPVWQPVLKLTWRSFTIYLAFRTWTLWGPATLTFDLCYNNLQEKYELTINFSLGLNSRWHYVDCWPDDLDLCLTMQVLSICNMWYLVL